MRCDVVITGMGVLAANGDGVDEFWRSLLAAESGITCLRQFEEAGLPVRIGGEVKNFRLSDYVPDAPPARRLARHTQLALAAAILALRDAGISPDTLLRSGPVPVAMGVATSAIDVIEDTFRRLAEKGPRQVLPTALPASMPNTINSTLIDLLHIQGVSLTLSTGCAAGTDAIGEVARRIACGEADIGIAGGADAPLTPLAMASFCRSNLLSHRNDDPKGASRPFDADRDGGVLAEGAGVLVLERRERALARGWRFHVRIAGFGSSGVDSDRKQTGFETSMRIALQDAGFSPTSVDCICAHGPSDPVLDRVETEAIQSVFGARAYAIPVTSIKGCTGNPLAAAGPMSVIAAARMLAEQRMPPTANLTTPGAGCDLDYVRGRCRAIGGRRALVNTHGLGHVSSTLALESAG